MSAETTDTSEITETAETKSEIDQRAERDLAARTAGWRLMVEAVRPQKWWIVVGVVSGFIWTLARLAVPQLAARAVDDGIRGGDLHLVLLLTLAMLAVGVVQALTTGLRRYCAFRIALRTETDLRTRLFAHLQRLHFAFHDEAQTGQLMARANSDLQQINTVVILLPLTAASMLTMIGVLIIMMMKSVVLAVLALGLLPLLNRASTRFSSRITPANLALQEELSGLSGVVEESLSGIRILKGFGAERLQVKRLDDAADGVLKQALRAAKLRAGFMPLIDLLPTLSLVAIIWYGGHLVLDGQLEIGDILAYNLYVLMLIWPLRMVGMLVAQSSRASAAAGRIHEILSTDVAVDDPLNPIPLPDGPGNLLFDGVSFGYGPGRLVLNGLDLSITGGEAVAIVGATGSGKTTVARLVPRFYDVAAGRVSIDGVDVRDLRVSELRDAVGIVFEDTFLFSDSIRRNIAFSDPGASIETIERAARLSGIHTFIQSLPQGYETLIGEHGYSLSGGQRQRIAIARAVLHDPRVLILDDATSAVDPSKEHEIRAALAEVMEGRTTLIIAHRPATIALADRVILLDGGRCIASGTHEELLASNERYREILARSDSTESSSLEGSE
ncbi:MAG: ABC transporter ATP-binding protein [Acidimicrobiia bacterium]|nr:ABC transporter ATP-binding protein [Acidimicrobiia bacterium]